jgi:hypothetical protein
MGEQQGQQGTSAAPPDVATQVFASFISALEATHVDPSVVARLRQTLIVEKVSTERALKAAIAGEEPADG